MNLRTTGLLLLLPAEAILLGVLFDAESLARLPRGWWSPVGLIAPKVLPLAIAIATSGLLLAGPQIHDQFSRHRPAPASRGRVYGFLAAHVLAFAALLVLTSALFTGRPALPNVGAVVAAWATAAALTGLFWAAALLPPGAIGLLASRAWALLLASAACGFLAWAAGEYTQHYWRPLRRGTLLIAAFLVHAVDATAWSDPAQYLIGARHFTVEISYQCSGYEGIGLTWIALTAWLVLYRPHLRPLPILLILLPAATLAVYLANAVRIAALVYVGAHWSADVAAGGFHSTAGAILFAGVVLATAWTARHLPLFTTDLLPPRPHEHGTNPAAPYLVPLLAFTAAALLTALFSRDHESTLYPVPVAAGLAALWPYRHEYRRLEWRLTLTPLLVGTLVAILWVTLAGTFDDPTFHATSVSPRWRLPWLACRVLGAVALVPLVEELAFRGYLARRLMDHDFWAVPLTQLSWPAVLISSLLFGVLHHQFLAAAAAGVSYALVARHRGRLTDAVLAHATTNALLAAAAIAL